MAITNHACINRLRFRAENSVGTEYTKARFDTVWIGQTDKVQQSEGNGTQFSYYPVETDESPVEYEYESDSHLHRVSVGDLSGELLKLTN